jgi:ABC-type glutathione transport system ATPase component
MYIHLKKIPWIYQTGKRLRKINDKIINIKHDITSFPSVSVSNQPQPVYKCNDLSQRWSSPVYDHTQVVGLEGDTRKVKDWLFEADGPNGGILAIGVVGMGGLGKTTLTWKVFNDKEVEWHFERRMWVSIDVQI